MIEVWVEVGIVVIGILLLFWQLILLLRGK